MKKTKRKRTKNTTKSKNHLQNSAHNILNTLTHTNGKYGSFGGKGAVIIEEIEVDEQGNFLGKNYRLLYDKRPKHLLANPLDFHNVGPLMDIEDLSKMREREHKLKKTHKRMKKVLRRFEKEREYLKDKERELEEREKYLKKRGLELKELPKYNKIETEESESSSEEISSIESGEYGDLQQAGDGGSGRDSLFGLSSNF